MMGANLTKLFSVDIESTCWNTPEEQGTKPNEVIEIGICVLNLKSTNAKTTITDKRSYPVKPKFTEISEFCTLLTGWSQAEIDKAPPIEEVLARIMADYRMTKNHIWCSYGEYDRVKLSSAPEQSGGLFDLYGIQRDANPFAQFRAHYNVKTLMALKERLPRELGMARALAHYGIELEGRHHNGADDAFNIAKILARVLA